MLSRAQRFEAIAVADAPALVAAADGVLAAHAVNVLRPPTGGAVMMRAIETAEGSVFNLGEVSVTEAEVEIGGRRGYAMVMGFAPEHALAGAVVDAALEADVEGAASLVAVLEDALAMRSQREAQEWQRLAPTLVSFDEIPE